MPTQSSPCALTSYAVHPCPPPPQAPDPAWLSAALSAARPLLPAFEPRDLVSLLSVLAALRRPPPAEWLGEALTVLGARVGALDGQGVAALLKVGGAGGGGAGRGGAHRTKGRRRAHAVEAGGELRSTLGAYARRMGNCANIGLKSSPLSLPTCSSSRSVGYGTWRAHREATPTIPACPAAGRRWWTWTRA